MTRESPGETPDLPRQFGNYELIDRLAVGGMAEIYLAKSTGIGGFENILVIKRLHDHLGQDDDFVEMLIDEAKIAVRLKHPNVAQILDLGRIDGQYFIAMEYIEGPDLNGLLKTAEAHGEHLPVPAALFITAECCSGLHYAHTRHDAEGRPMRIVHRDVSPPNIMLSVEGEVKIVDFGVAKARKRAQQTRQGVIKGKFQYMAPEQADGERVDGRTDVFSTGMVLYEMLCGTNPYDQYPKPQLVEEVRRADIPPMRQYRPSIAPELDELVMRALHRNPDRRYPSAAEFDRAISDYRERNCDPYNRRQLAQLVRRYSREGRGGSVATPEEATSPGGRPETRDREAMSPSDYEAPPSSVLYDGKGDVPPEKPTHPAGDRGGDDNPFGDDEPTRVWNRDGGGRGEASSGGEAAGRRGSGGGGRRDAGGGSERPTGGTHGRQQETREPDSATSTGGSGGREAPTREVGTPGAASGAGAGQQRGGQPEQDDDGGVLIDEDELPPMPDAEEIVAPSHPPDDRSDGDSEAGSDVETGSARVARAPSSETTARELRERMAGGVDRVAEWLERAGVARQVQVYLGVALGLTLVVGVGVGTMVAWNTSSGSSAPETIEKDPEGASASGEAEASTVDVPVRSEPEGVTVRIDGESAGKTPVVVEDLEVGKSYELTFDKEGYLTEVRDLAVSEEGESVSVSMREAAGELKVTTDPEGAVVEVDGEEVGESPVTVERLARSDQHEVVVQLDGESKTETVTWEDDEADRKELELVLESEADGRDEHVASATSGGRDRPDPRPSRRQPNEQARSQGSGGEGRTKSGRESDSETKTEDLFAGGSSSGGDEGAGGGSQQPDQGGDEGASKEESDEPTDLDIWGMGEKGGGEEKSGSGGSDGAEEGYLSVQVRGGWGKVYVDDELVSSETPLVEHGLEPGSYTIKVYYPVLKRSSSERTVEIEAGETTRSIFEP